MLSSHRRAAGVLVLMGALLAAAPAESPVADAAMRDDVEAVRSLVARGVDVNAAQADGMTALHWAAVNGNPALAEILVRAGANLEGRTRNGAYRPLHLASRAGHHPVARVLLEAGSEVDAPTATGGASALHLAAAAGSVETIEALLEHGAVLDARDRAWGQTPLVYATARNRIEAMKILLARGADPSVTTEVVDLGLQAALDAAARQARDRALGAVGVGPDAATRPTPAQVRAAVLASQEVQRSGVLPDTQGDDAPREDGEIEGYPESVGTQGGLTPLLHAVREGHTEAARLLLDAGADIDQPKAGDRTTPLHMAIINGHYDLALELLTRGADPDLASTDGATPLISVLNNYWAPKSRYPQQHAHMVQRASYLDTMEALLEAGADPDARLERMPWYLLFTFGSLGVDMRGATAFWRAAHATDVEAMRLLVRHGADPSLPTLTDAAAGAGEGRAARSGGEGGDPSGLPPVPPGGPAVYPIHAAAGVGYGNGYTANFHRHAPDGWLPAVRYLVEELGADVNVRDLNGYNVIHHAAARGDDALILYLVEKGADVMAVSRRGQTTVDMANGPGQRISPHPSTIALLEGLGAKNNHRCVSC